MSYLLKKDLKYTPRPEQTKALEFIKKTFEQDGNVTKFFMLDLPVGVGKSYLAFMFMDWYLKNVKKSAKFDVLTNSRILQEQYTQDFDSISNLWGKNNYQCSSYDCSCAEGKEFNKLNKTKCEDCPYDAARDHYIRDQINLSNFHLYTLLNIYNEQMMSQRESNVLIIDEAHDFEQILSDFISINISESSLKSMGFKNFKAIGKSIKFINTVEDFVDFVDNLKQEIGDTKANLKHEIFSSGLGKKGDKRDLKLGKLLGGTNPSVKLMKRFADVETLETKLKNFTDDYSKRPENWVLEYSFSENKEKRISIQPVWAAPYLDEYVWSKYDHVVLMSGTILNKKLFSYINGIPEALTAYYSIGSPFNVRNRPIYYMPVSRMTFKNKENAFKQYQPFVEKLMGKYKRQKGIFHTVTYEIADWVRENVKDDRFIFHSTDDKDKALKKHYELEDEPTVLVSPSMGTGVNLEYDRARFQILMKIPYPSLGSKKNKLRQKMMPEWYTWRTVAGIIQAYGRAIRSYDDKSDFVIMDGCFSDIMKYSSDWLPGYFVDAIRKVDVDKLKRQINEG